MSDTQSDRSVLPFPTELRLEIYRNLVKKTYLALGTTPELQLSDPNGDPKPLTASAGLVILRVSKATSAEALKLLYQESVFLFKLDFTTKFSCDPPPQKAVALMKNVSFEISAMNSAAIAAEAPWGIIRVGPRPTRQDLMSQRTIELFIGTACFRNVMRIRFMDCAHSTRYITSQRFDDALKDLAGFRKLVVEFDSPRNSRLVKPWYTLEQALAVSRSQCEEFKDSKLKYDFEPAYGPAVQGTVHDASNYACYLEFHPRQYVASDLILKAAKMVKEAARLIEGERAVAPLPEMIETLELL